MSTFEFCNYRSISLVNVIYDVYMRLSYSSHIFINRVLYKPKFLLLYVLDIKYLIASPYVHCIHLHAFKIKHLILQYRVI